MYPFMRFISAFYSTETNRHWHITINLGIQNIISQNLTTLKSIRLSPQCCCVLQEGSLLNGWKGQWVRRFSRRGRRTPDQDERISPPQSLLLNTSPGETKGSRWWTFTFSYLVIWQLLLSKSTYKSGWVQLKNTINTGAARRPRCMTKFSEKLQDRGLSSCPTYVSLSLSIIKVFYVSLPDFCHTVHGCLRTWISREPPSAASPSRTTATQ